MKNYRLAVSGVAILIALGLTSCGSSTPQPKAPLPAQVPEVSESEPETLSNTIKWSTASEVDNFGFDVYRGNGPDGPFERLTEEPIEGAGTSDEKNDYKFVDDTIDPTKAYYYYVESISMSGVREHFTPIGKAKAKIEPSGSEPE